jgi:hypothetical protein
MRVCLLQARHFTADQPGRLISRTGAASTPWPLYWFQHRARREFIPANRLKAETFTPRPDGKRLHKIRT